MLSYCNHCRVTVRGSSRTCPLCHNVLPRGGSDEMDLAGRLYDEEMGADVYPYVKVRDRIQGTRWSLAIWAFILVLLDLVLQAIDPFNPIWVVPTIGGILLLWLFFDSAVRRRRYIARTILAIAVLLSVLAVGVDLLTGFRSWSFNYSLPFFFMMIMGGVTLWSFYRRSGRRQYLLQILVILLLGILSGALVFIEERIDFILLIPSILSTAIALVLVVGLIINYFVKKTV